MSDFIGRPMLGKAQMPAASPSIGGFDRMSGQTNWPGAQPAPMAGQQAAAQGQLGAMQGAMQQGQAQQALGGLRNNAQVAPTQGQLNAMRPAIPLGYGR